MSRLADAHIEGQRRIRDRARQAAQIAWEGLGSYDEEDVNRWLLLVLPLVLGAQRASALLINQFLARAVGRQPLSLDLDRVTGASTRNGTPPREVYRRPFVTTWTDLKNGSPWEEAVKAGMDRATTTVQTDVQLAMRATLQEVGASDDRIVGFQRVPDGDACDFCRLIAGQRYLASDLLPVHDRCGCGVDVITQANRGDFTGNTRNDLDLPPGVAIRDHGELGPVVVSPDHHFKDLAAIQAAA